MIVKLKNNIIIMICSLFKACYIFLKAVMVYVKYILKILSFVF